MEQRLLLEGPSIDELLERVRDEHGPQARIIHAEQRRVGGVGGFFARRRYELAVEVDDTYVPDHADPDLTSALPVRHRAIEAAGAAPGERSSLDTLLDFADRQDGRVGDTAGPSEPATVPATQRPYPGPRRGAHAAPAIVATEVSTTEAVAAERGTGPADLPAAETGAEPAPQGRPVSTQSPQFEQMLRDLVARAGADAASMDLLSTDPADPPFVPSTPVELTSPSWRPRHAAPDQQPVLDYQEASVLDDQRAAEQRAAQRPEPWSSVAPTLPPLAAPPADQTVAAPTWDAPLFDQALAAASAWAGQVAADALTDPLTDPLTGPAAADPGPAAPAGPAGDASSWPRLAALGASWLDVAGVAADLSGPVDEQALLLRLVAGIAVGPSRPPVRGAAVIIGEAGPARDVAHAWCADAGLRPSDVVEVRAADVDPARLARDVAAAQGWGGMAVVVLETGPTRAAARIAGRLASMLGAGPLVAVVDASRDTAVTRDWVSALEDGGRAVQEIAAHSVAESPAPLRLTSLGRPVTWLDGRPATVGAWAAPCLDRWDSSGA